MLAVSEALVHFVGLCVFMTEPSAATLKTRPAKSVQIQKSVSSPPRVVVVLPEVLGFGPGMARTRKVKGDSGLSLVQLAAEIERHTALIAFKESDYRIISPGWERHDLWTEKDEQGKVIAQWKYIELSHDRIRFQTGIAGTPPNSLQGVALPHINDQLGGGSHALVPGYQSPFTAAAAVIELPAGTLTSCLSQIPEVEDRTDTEVTVPNSGQLTISGGNGKFLTLDGGASVFIGNVPLDYAQHLDMTDSPGHYLAYCAMTNGTQCAKPQTRPNELRDRLPRCKTNGMVANPVNADARVADVIPFPLLMSFECSNTQWP